MPCPRADTSLEGLAGLGLIVGSILFQALLVFLLLIRELIERAQRVLDALDRAERTLRAEMSGVESGSLDEEVGHRLAVESQARQYLSPTQDLESPEGSPRLHGEILAPERRRIGKSVGGFLARALTAIDLIADGHPEFLVGVRIARRDVLGETRQCLLCLDNPLRKLAKLRADRVVLVQVGGAKLVELAEFSVDLHLLHHGGIARGDGLDFRVGERAALEVFGHANRGLPAHHLLDEAGLGFKRLPHIVVERSFRDVTVDFDFLVYVALAENPSLALLDVAGPPRRVEMVVSSFRKERAGP